MKGKETKRQRVDRLGAKVGALTQKFLREKAGRHSIDGDVRYLNGQGILLKATADGDPKNTRSSVLYLDVFVTALLGKPQVPLVDEVAIEYSARSTTRPNVEIVRRRGLEGRQKLLSAKESLSVLDDVIKTFKGYGLR